MAQNGYQRLYMNMAPLYTSSAVERAVGQGTKFALDGLNSIIGKVNFMPIVDPTRDLEGLITVALTVAEYYLNFIRFSLSASTGHESRTIDAVKLAQASTMELEKRLSSLGPLSEECEVRACRTKSCFRDVLLSLEEWRQPQEGGANTWRGAQANEILEPMLRSSNIFESEAERNFMQCLRHVHLRAAVLSPLETLQELYDLCHLLRPDTINLSEVMTDTALRSIIIILFKTKNQLFQGNATNEIFSQNACNYLKSCFLRINRPAHLQWEEQNCLGYKNYVRNRKWTIVSELGAISAFYMTASQRQDAPPVPVIEVTASVPPSTLWQRLQSVESLAALTEGKEEEKCAICREEVFRRDDFGILSNCPHLFCVRCIGEWFKTKSTCPICRALTSSWTTKKHYEDSTNRRKIVGDTEQPVKRQRRN